MVQVQQLHVILAALLAVATVMPLTAQPAPEVGAPSTARKKFFPDDPIRVMPKPRNVEKAKPVKFNDIFDVFYNTLAHPGERQPEVGPPIRAMGANTLDEVPDTSTWYVNRHYPKRLSLEELTNGPGENNPPSFNGPWKILSLKDQGVTPGFMMEDSRKQRYFIKFDPITNPEMATAADVIGSRFFHAFGYFVPEYHLVRFNRDQLAIAEGATMRVNDRKLPITPHDVDRVLSRLAREKDGRFRAVASALVTGNLLGPFRFNGTRADDPNDIFPHEHRRDLRGLYVFCAWLGHDDSRSINTLDTLIDIDGVKVVRHELMDFGSILGSGSTKSNPARNGNQYLFAWKPAAIQLATFGFYVPHWEKYDFNYMPSVGRFEWELFDPEHYYPEYPNPAFRNRLPDDEFWAAKQVMNFTDEEIDAVVKSGEYSDPKAHAWVVECLRKRRDKIGRAFFNKVLPLDKFAIDNGRLTYIDLAELHKLAPTSQYAVDWSEFDNANGKKSPIPGAFGSSLPERLKSAAPGTYWVADIRGDRPKQSTAVYLRKTARGAEIVGVERFW